MKNKFIWLVVSGLMVAALLMASCGPAEIEEPKVEEPKVEEPKVEEPKVEEPIVEEPIVEEPTVEVPKYGGILNLGATSSPNALDQCYSPTGGYDALTEEDLLSGDWTKGPAGTGEVSYMYPVFEPPDMSMGLIAESFEMPDPDTLVYNIRKGIYFHDKPPTNGREVTADDVVFSMLRLWKDCPRSFHAAFLPWSQNLVSIEATDRWTVVLKTLPGRAGLVYEPASDITKIIPHEAVEQYGDVNDWKNVVGTGPFMLTDYIKDSTATLTRNPNYWMTDPVGPGKGMQLPYLDGVKYIIMPDLSTRMAALRTNKVDRLDIDWENAARFRKEKPELKYTRYFTQGATIYMKVNNPELPFYDKKVRHALALAIDNQEIADTFYGGEAEVYNYPVAPVMELEDYWIPFEDLPESTRELYGYHPDKAKQLLAEAGYPNGFKTEVILLSTEVDLMSIVKAYWADIGVELELAVREGPVKTGIAWRKMHKEMIAGNVQSLYPYTFMETRTGHYANNSVVSDEIVDAANDAVRAGYFDMEERYKAVKGVTEYLLDQAWFVVLPGDYAYIFWQPWVKNYHGENYVGFVDADWPRYVWIDQDLKEEMTGRR